MPALRPEQWRSARLADSSAADGPGSWLKASAWMPRASLQAWQVARPSSCSVARTTGLCWWPAVPAASKQAHSTPEMAGGLQECVQAQELAATLRASMFGQWVLPRRACTLVVAANDCAQQPLLEMERPLFAVGNRACSDACSRTSSCWVAASAGSMPDSTTRSVSLCNGTPASMPALPAAGKRVWRRVIGIVVGS